MWTAGGRVVGTTLQHYRILDLLGRGGMGEVYLADDTKLGRRVAVKMLPPDVAGDRERRARFTREASVLASLNHPNIVTIHAVESVDRHDFIVMELVDGEPLDRVIARGGLRVEQLLALATEMADALAAAHDQGVIHRDLKPSNVMVTPDGHAKILDFGLARRARNLSDGSTLQETASELTRAGTFLGTVPYMSPEQVQGGPVDARSDVFSFGVVLYEMAVGRPPFPGSTLAEITASILRDSPPPVDAVRADLPQGLARIVRRSVEKDPERRYQSAKEVRNELNDLTKEIAAERVLASARAAPPAGTSRFRVSAKLALGAVSLFALAAVWSVGRPVLERFRDPGRAAESPIRSLAVLPFQAQMSGTEQEYLVEGMHDALVTDLSKISALRVISRTSVLRYRDTTRPIPEIARELGVDAVVEGSVLLAEGRVRVTAQLIRGATDTHVWADSYDRDLENVLRLLSEIAGAIAREIHVVVTREEQDRLVSAPAASPEVQELYLKARFFTSSVQAGDLRKAIDLYRQAIDRDDMFAPAHAGLAQAELLTGFFGSAPLDASMSRAESAARRAFALDPTLAAAHSALGLIKLYYRWDWTATVEFKRALELNPNDVFARHGLADHAAFTGNHDESLRQVELARQSDPLSPLALLPVPAHLEFARHYDEAIRVATEILELFPDNRSARALLGDVLLRTGANERALDAYRRAAEGNATLLEAIERGYRAGGAQGLKRAMADHYAARGGDNLVTVATLYAAAGEPERALDWLDKAIQARRPQVLHVKMHPDFDSLHGNPRYESLLKRIGFPE
ncbi:MAG TPA: protein kinase [Vicinamibacterales bacterium]|nr:protein kinase [Vicinamibacterales bacterium]